MNYKWTNLSIGEAVVSGVLVIVSVYICWTTWLYFNFEQGYREALQQFGSKRYGNVIGPLDNALSNYGNWTPALLLKGRMLVGEDKFDRADDVYKRIAAGDDGRMRTAALIGRAVIRLRRASQSGEAKHLEEAQSFLQKAKASGHLSMDVRAQLGQLALRRYFIGEKKEALKNAAKIFRKIAGQVSGSSSESPKPIHRSSLSDLYAGQAVVQAKNGNYTTARKTYDSLYLLDPERPETLVNRGYIIAQYYQQGDVSEEMVRQKSLRKWAMFSSRLRRRGKSQGNSRLGKELLESAFQLQMAIAMNCHRREGDYGFCETLYKNAKHKIPGGGDRPELNLSRALILLDKGKQFLENNQNGDARRVLEKARYEFENVLEMNLSDEERYFVLINTGTVYYHMGREFAGKRLAKARRRLKEARKLFPDKAKTYRDLAIAYYAESKATKSKPEEARNYGEKYIDMADDPDESFKKWFDSNL